MDGESMTYPRQNLSEPDEYGDIRYVAEFENGEGIEIESPGCGTAYLTNEQAEKLRLWLNEREHKRKIEEAVDRNYEGELYDADPTCKHEVLTSPSGGLKCRKCTGWFCY